MIVNLPSDIRIEIVKLIPYKNYNKVAMVCKQFCDDLSNEYVWQHVYRDLNIGNHKENYQQRTKQYLLRWRWNDHSAYQLAVTDNITTIATNNYIYGNEYLPNRTLVSENYVTPICNSLKFKIENMGTWMKIGVTPGTQSSSNYMELVLLNAVLGSSQAYTPSGSIIAYQVVKENDIIEMYITEEIPFIKKIKFKLNNEIIYKTSRHNLYNVTLYPLISLANNSRVSVINNSD